MRHAFVVTIRHLDGTTIQLLDAARVDRRHRSRLNKAILRGDPDVQPAILSTRAHRQHLYKLVGGRFQQSLINSVRARFTEDLSGYLSVSQVALTLGVDRSRLSDAIWAYLNGLGRKTSAEEFGVSESALEGMVDLNPDVNQRHPCLRPDKAKEAGLRIFFYFRKSRVDAIRQEFQPAYRAGYATAAALAKEAGIYEKHYAALLVAIERGDPEVRPDIPASEANPMHQYKLTRGMFKRSLLEAVRKKYGEDLSNYILVSQAARKCGRATTTLLRGVWAYLLDQSRRPDLAKKAITAGIPESALRTAAVMFSKSDPGGHRLRPDKVRRCGSRFSIYLERSRLGAIEQEFKAKAP